MRTIGRVGPPPDPFNSIHIYTSADVAACRVNLITDIFGSGTLPSDTGTLASVTSPVTGLTGLASCQKITFSGGVTAIPKLWTPTARISRLMILHQGHTGTYMSYRYNEALQTYLTAGLDVIGCVMPGGIGGDSLGNTSGTSASHRSDMQPLSEFLFPTIGALNTVGAGNYSHVYMSGLSGGGWTTTLAAAMDVRIEKSYPTAGSLPEMYPVDVFYGQGSRDWEQQLWRHCRASYLDCYILAGAKDDGTSGRRQKQILHTTDECCFNQAEYDTGKPYAARLATHVSGLGGSYELKWKTKTTHEFDTTIITDEIIPEIT